MNTARSSILGIKDTMILGLLWGHVILNKKVTLATKRSNAWGSQRFTTDDIQQNQRCYQTHDCSCFLKKTTMHDTGERFDCNAFVNTANSMEWRLCRHANIFHCFKHGFRCQNITFSPHKIRHRISTPYPTWTWCNFNRKTMLPILLISCCVLFQFN